MINRWSAFRQRQRALLRESNHPRHPDEVAAEVAPETAGASSSADEPSPAPHSEPTGDAFAASPESEPTDDSTTGSAYGLAGRPMNRQSPFYVGFTGAVGVVVALGLWHAIGRLATTFTILVVALFLTLALDPMVQWLLRRGLKRPTAVGIVFAGVLVVFTILGAVVVPPVVDQATELTKAAPGYLQHVLDTKWLKDIDKNYGVIEKAQTEFTKRVQDPNFLSGVFGGVLGAGRAVLSGLFEAFTVLILTLYFLSSLPRVKQAAYGLVPLSRRPRFVPLAEEIMRRVGSYAIGQVAVASVNGFLSWIMMSIVGIPYAAVLAVVVGFLGLVPMVGATLGAAVVCVVAFFDEPRKAIIALIYYLIYQQIENYVVVPRIMQRTVSVPGAVTVVAALAGGTLLGMLGALLAIPVAAGLLLLYEEVLLPRQQQH